MSDETPLTPASFFTRATSEEGKKLFLKFPGGKLSDAWLLAQGRGSDAYTEAYGDYRMKTLELAAKGTPSEIDKRDLLVRFLAKLVKGWSFDARCTTNAVEELLIEAPYVREDLDVFVHDRESFFG